MKELARKAARATKDHKLKDYYKEECTTFYKKLNHYTEVYKTNGFDKMMDEIKINGDENLKLRKHPEYDEVCKKSNWYNILQHSLEMSFMYGDDSMCIGGERGLIDNIISRIKYSEK